MKHMLIFVEDLNGKKEIEEEFEKVLVVGYGGRNLEKVMEHIHELEQIGVAPPPTIPTIYPQELTSLTTENFISVEGQETSGEAEYVLYHDGQEWLVTVGSDHTDRLLETKDIQKSKEACPKPMATTFWRLQELEDHWDQLILRSWVVDSKGRRLYQEHNLTALLPVPQLLGKLQEFGYDQLSKTVIFSGTVPTLEGFVYADKFELELEDPVLKRSIKGEYFVNVKG